MSDLDLLPRKLAERIDEKYELVADNGWHRTDEALALARKEAVEDVAGMIREAIEKTLEEAAEIVLDKANASLHEGAAPSGECQICKWLVISAEAIRSLKRAKSGMETEPESKES